MSERLREIYDDLPGKYVWKELDRVQSELESLEERKAILIACILERGLQAIDPNAV